MDRSPIPRRRPTSARRAGFLATIAAIAAYGFVACNSPAASSLPSIPSIAIPTSLPSVAIPSDLLPSGSLTGCVPPATAAIVNQLTQQGADVKTVLTQNRDALISGLQSFQPSDSTTMTWRDNLVSALQSGDLDTAATQVQMLTSGQVTLTTC